MADRAGEHERLLTPAEVAAMFHVDPKTVTRWAKAGKLTAITTLGGHRRFKASEVEALASGTGIGLAAPAAMPGPPPPPVQEPAVVEQSVAQEPAPAPPPPPAPSRHAPTVFISNASEDADVARGLATAMEANGVRTWQAARDVAIGANYAAEIMQALMGAEYLMVVLSPAGIGSPHVRREVSIAIDRGLPVLPVSLDPTDQLISNLPSDWAYWLSLAQVFRMNEESATAAEISRRVLAAGP